MRVKGIEQILLNSIYPCLKLWDSLSFRKLRRIVGISCISLCACTHQHHQPQTQASTATQKPPSQAKQEVENQEFKTAEKQDTSVKKVSNTDSIQVHETNKTPPNKGIKSPLEGIDVSHYQGDVDWRKVKDEGIIFAFIKASQGQHTVDKKFKRNHQQLESLKMPWGVYHYLDPSIDAYAQAHHFIQTVDKNIGHFPPIVDIEAFEDQSLETIKNVLDTYITLIEKYYNCKPIIYTAPHFWDRLHDHDYGEYGLWLANYAANPHLPAGWDDWLFWQYTSKGQVDGVDGEVDRNQFKGDLNNLKSLKCDMPQYE